MQKPPAAPAAGAQKPATKSVRLMSLDALRGFDSNLVLDCKKARGSCVKPWSALVELNQTGGMVAGPGIEPGTQGFSVLCSTN